MKHATTHTLAHTKNNLYDIKDIIRIRKQCNYVYEWWDFPAQLVATVMNHMKHKEIKGNFKFYISQI